MKKFRALIFIILFLGAIGLLIWYLSGFINSQLDAPSNTKESQSVSTPTATDSSSPSAATPGESSDLAEVTTTRLSSLGNSYFETIGTVTSRGTVSVYPLASGSVKKVNFQEGDYVKAGDVLLEITGANLSDHLATTQLQIAQTTLANARASYENLQKTSAESLRTAGLQLQSATNQASAIQYDLAVIENNRSALEDSLGLLQDSFNNTEDKNNRDQYKAERDIDNLIFTLNAAQDDRSRNQRQLDDLENQLQNLQSQTSDPANPQIAALQTSISKIETALAAQDKGIEELYVAIDKARYGYSTAENGANLGENTVQGQIVTAENQARVLDLTLESTRTKLGYTGDSSDALLLARQAYQATKVQLQTALDSAENAIKLAELNVELANNQAAALQVKAPFAGIITVLDLYPGQSVNPQLAAAEIIDPQSFQLKAGVDISTAERISSTSPALIELGGRTIEVPVKSVSLKVDDKTKLVNVTLALPNIFFKINQNLKVKLPLSTASGLSSGTSYLPLDAVVIGTESQFVYINDGGKTKKVEVKIGQVSGDQIEILSGLPADAEIILTGAKNLAEGQEIKVVNS